jgi:hypothetical protein
MKAIVLVSTLVLAMGLQSAQALSLNDYIRADVTPVQIDKLSPLASINIRAAQINYDTAKSVLTLTIQVAGNNCAPDMVCLAVMPEPIVISIPKTEQVTDSCGRVTYIGASEDFQYGQAILFTDMANSNCPQVSPAASYEVEYQVFDKAAGSTATALFVKTTDTEQVGLPVLPPASM